VKDENRKDKNVERIVKLSFPKLHNLLVEVKIILKESELSDKNLIYCKALKALRKKLEHPEIFSIEDI